MGAVWRLARAAAAAGRPFRILPAFVKGGRERYGVCEETQARFGKILSQTTEPLAGVPLPGPGRTRLSGRGFFHPLDDANGRAALLTMGFVLAREKVFLDESVPSACAGTPMMRSVHWRWLG
jgi:hypothetical protein